MSVGPLCRLSTVAILLSVLVAGTAGVAVAHQIVLFTDRPFETTTDGTVTVPIEFHQTEDARLRILAPTDGEETTADGNTTTGTDSASATPTQKRLLTATVVDTDGDGVVRVRVDLAALAAGDGGLSADSGAIRSSTVPDGAFGPGEYTVTVDPPATGTGDETTLRVVEPSPSTETADEPPTTPAGSDTPPGTDVTVTPTADSVSEPTTPDSSGSDSRPPLSVVLTVLFGPAVPVAALAVTARVVR